MFRRDMNKYKKEAKGNDYIYSIKKRIHDVLLSNAELPGIPYGWGVRMLTYMPLNSTMLLYH